MNVAYFTTTDPLYLPTFFEEVLSVESNSSTIVYLVSPLYKNQTAIQAALRYFRTFGIVDTAILATKILVNKIKRKSIQSVCAKYGVQCQSIEDVNSQQFLDQLKERGIDLIVSVSCPQIFKSQLMEVPILGCLNIHGAILPQYRGVLPSFWMLANGEKKAGVSIFFMTEEIDGGDLCGQRVFDILPDESLDKFLKRSKKISSELLIEVFSDIQRETVSRRPLDISKGSYYSWPDKEAVQRFRNRGRSIF